MTFNCSNCWNCQLFLLIFYSMFSTAYWLDPFSIFLSLYIPNFLQCLLVSQNDRTHSYWDWHPWFAILVSAGNCSCWGYQITLRPHPRTSAARYHLGIQGGCSPVGFFWLASASWGLWGFGQGWALNWQLPECPPSPRSHHHPLIYLHHLHIPAHGFKSSRWWSWWCWD